MLQQMLQSSALSLWPNAASITTEHVVVNSLELFPNTLKFSQLVMFSYFFQTVCIFSWNLSFEIPHMFDVQTIVRVRLFYS